MGWVIAGLLALKNKNLSLLLESIVFNKLSMVLQKITSKLKYHTKKKLKEQKKKSNY